MASQRCREGLYFYAAAGCHLFIAFTGLLMSAVALWVLGGSEPSQWKSPTTSINCMPGYSDSCPVHECDTYPPQFWKDECKRCVDHRRDDGDWKAIKQLCCTKTMDCATADSLFWPGLGLIALGLIGWASCFVLWLSAVLLLWWKRASLGGSRSGCRSRERGERVGI
jgi:hypothetical protein